MTQSLANSLEAQRRRLLKALQERPITTLEAREKLDILHPAGRIKELRAQGYLIVTTWVVSISLYGKRHRVGLYSLLPSQGVNHDSKAI